VLAERDRIREQARVEGLEAGRAEGREAALRAERERLAQETAGVRELLRQALAGLEAARAELIAAAERDLVSLAVKIAGKIVKREAASGPSVAPENVRRAIALLARRSDVRVLLHPSDLKAVEAALPGLAREFADLGAVAVESSPAVQRGGCRVVTREGAVDADVAVQLEEIERGLLG
jgi:flagellar assembly protein FliH